MEDKKLTSQTVNKDNTIATKDVSPAAKATDSTKTDAIKDDAKVKADAKDDKVKADAKDSKVNADAKDSKVKADAKDDKVKADAKDDKVKADAKDADDDADEELLDADGKPIKKDAKKVAPVEELREPGSVFIDHGAILPEFIPGTHLFALIRDPGTLYVYWNSEVESAHGWKLTAFDARGNVLQSFTTTHRRSGRGYFHIPTMLASRVTLEMVQSDGSIGMKLESTIKILEQSKHKPEERWVDVQNNAVVYEAPAPGHAPEYSPALEAHRAQMNAIAGGGIEAMLAAAPADLVPGHAPSSWFGPLRAPGSSDIFMGSSDLSARKH